MWYVKFVESPSDNRKWGGNGIVIDIVPKFIYTLRDMETEEEIVVSGTELHKFRLYGCLEGEYWSPTSEDLSGIGLVEREEAWNTTDIYITVGGEEIYRTDIWEYSLDRFKPSSLNVDKLLIEYVPEHIYYRTDDVYFSKRKLMCGAHMLARVLSNAPFDITKYEHFYIKAGDIHVGTSEDIYIGLKDKDEFLKYYTKYVMLKRGK